MSVKHRKSYSPAMAEFNRKILLWSVNVVKGACRLLIVIVNTDPSSKQDFIGYSGLIVNDERKQLQQFKMILLTETQKKSLSIDRYTCIYPLGFPHSPLLESY